MAEKFNHQAVKLQWIPVRNLAVVWGEAQRQFKPTWAKEIAEGFDPEKFDPIKVMQPNGNGIYHICEGQHRVGAVRLLWGDHELVPCLVAEASDPARAAEIFLDTNTNRAIVSKIAKFKVSVVAQRQEEVAIDRIVRHCGYRVDGSHNNNCIAAVDALKFVYRKGAKTLDRTLSVLRQSWGGDASAVSSPLIKGLGAFICEFSETMDAPRLVGLLSKTTPGRMANDIKGIKETHHINTVEAAIQLLLRLYNRGLRDDKKLQRKKKE